MTQAIRLSPSGPVIANAGGGPFAPGPGASLRLVEAQCTIGGSLAIPTVPVAIGPTLGAVGFFDVLAGPNPALNYRASVLLDVFNGTTNASASVELYLDSSTDGVTFTELASNTHLVAQNGGRQIRLDKRLTSGVNFGVVAGQASLYLRARIGASTQVYPNVLAESALTPGDTPGSVGTVLMQLEECF